jgi:hypothetical protein
MKTKITFRYTETPDFEPPTEVVMDIPERSIDEMCEYFQRFLLACGYILEEDEQIRLVKREPEGKPPKVFGNEFLGYVNEDCEIVAAGPTHIPYSWKDDIIFFGDK